MKFCPNCDIRLKKTTGSNVLSCTKCDYTEGGKSISKKHLDSEEPQSDFMAVSYTHLTLPTNREV